MHSDSCGKTEREAIWVTTTIFMSSMLEMPRIW